jgi:putative adenylate-forming enzyme
MLAANSTLYKTTQKSGRLAFRFFDLRQGLACHREAIEVYQPTLLIAPAHVLGLMARQNWAIHPERAFSAAEVLDQREEEIIGTSWGKPVHQIYQCTEGFLGITCRHGTIHLNEDYLLVEKQWLDKKRLAFTPLITDFSRRSQAMVRYKMNDILIARPSPCPCGSPLQAIARIEGRRDDILAFPSDQGGVALLFPDDVRATVLDAAPAASDFQVRQHSPERLSLALDGPVPEEQTRNAAAKLNEAIRRVGGMTVHIEVTPFIQIEDHAIKLRRVARSFALSDDVQ